MKPRLIDRLLLAVVLIVFIACMVAVLLCIFNIINADMRQTALEALDFGERPYLCIGVGAAALLLGIIAVKLLFTKSKSKQTERSNTASLLRADENGAAYISAASIDSMAQRYIKGNSRIKECASNVKIDENQGVSIDLKATVLADTNVPELCDKVRKELKEYIEEYAGVTISQISMIVVGTYSPANAARVN